MTMTLPMMAVMSAFLIIILYVFFNSFIGQEAYEEKKIKNRLKNLIHIQRQSLIRKTQVSSITVLNEVLGQAKWMTEIDELLKTAKLNITPVGFVLVDLVVFFMGAWGISTLLGNFDAAFMAGLVFATIPFGYLVLMKGKYVNDFMMKFPDALGMMKNAVRAGQGLQSAFKLVAEEGPYPLANEFARMMKEIEYGGHLDEALNNLYKRIKTVDVRLFVLGILIQTELGGNIGELLENVSRTIRERITLNREIKALTSQAKSSALILAGLPFLIMGVLSLVSPGYFDPFFKDPFGQKVFTGTLVWMSIGATIIIKMTRGIKMGS